LVTLEEKHDRFHNVGSDICGAGTQRMYGCGNVFKTEYTVYHDYVNQIFSKSERRKITFKTLNKLTPLIDRAYN
jgi:hypothetical protein